MTGDPDTTQRLHSMMQITEQTIYLMGISFVLGSLFTILMLVVLEFVRSLNMSKEENTLDAPPPGP